MPYGKRKFNRTKRGTGGGKAVMLPSTAPPAKRPFKSVNNYRVKNEPFPRVLQTVGKFSDVRRLNVINPTLAASHTYAVNTIYDPDFSGTGKTITGWTQLQSIYARYLVTGCKINVSFQNPSGQGHRVGIRLRINAQGSTLSRTLQQLSEQPMTYISGISDTGSNKKNFSFYVRPWTLFGLSKLEYFANTDRYSAPMDSVPLGPPGTATSPGCFFDIFLVNPDNTLVILPSVDVVVRMQFNVQCYERKYLSSTVPS